MKLKVDLLLVHKAHDLLVNVLNSCSQDDGFDPLTESRVVLE